MDQSEDEGTLLMISDAFSSGEGSALSATRFQRLLMRGRWRFQARRRLVPNYSAFRHHHLAEFRHGSPTHRHRSRFALVDSPRELQNRDRDVCRARDRCRCVWRALKCIRRFLFPAVVTPLQRPTRFDHTFTLQSSISLSLPVSSFHLWVARIVRVRSSRSGYSREA